MNKVQLYGVLGRDPEVRWTQSGAGVVTFSLAVNERYKDRDGEWQQKTVWVDVTIFGKRGEAFARFHKKGAPALIDGKLAFDSWEDKHTGAKRSKLYVVAEAWHFVGPKQSGDGGGREPSGGRAGTSDPDPWAGGSDYPDDGQTPF